MPHRALIVAQGGADAAVHSPQIGRPFVDVLRRPLPRHRIGMPDERPDRAFLDRAFVRSTASHDQVADDAERPDWLYWCSRDESDLRAVPLLTAALERYDTTHVREVALYSSWLAQAYVDANEIDEAAAVASRVYDLAAASDSPRAVQRLDTVLDALAPHRDAPAVRHLLDRAAS